MRYKAYKLPKKPKIPKYFYIIPMDGDKLQARASFRTVILKGKSVRGLVPKLIPQLDGTKTVPEIVSILENVDKNVVIEVLNMLNKNRLLEDSSVKPSFKMSPEELDYYNPQISFFSQLSDDKYKFQGLLKNSQVAIFGLGEVGSKVLLSLIASGVGRIIGVDEGIIEARDLRLGSFYFRKDIGQPKHKVAEGIARSLNPYISFKGLRRKIKNTKDVLDLIDGCNLVVLCVERLSLAVYNWVNEACLEKKIPWTSGSLNIGEGIIGPSIIPYETPCYKCYELRAKGNIIFYEESMAFENYLNENLDSDVESGSLNCFGGIVGSFVALEAIKILSRFTYPTTYGHIYVVNFFTLEAKLHEILKLPRCPSCGPNKKSPIKKVWNL